MSEPIIFSSDFDLGTFNTTKNSSSLSNDSTLNVSNNVKNNNNNHNNNSSSLPRPRNDSLTIQPPPASRRESDGTVFLNKFPNPIVTVTSSESTTLSFNDAQSFLFKIEAGSPDQLDPITGFAKNRDENDFSDLESLLNDHPADNTLEESFDFLSSPNLNGDALTLLKSPDLDSNNSESNIKRESFDNYLIFPTPVSDSITEQLLDGKSHPRTLSINSINSINSLHSIPSIQYTPNDSINDDCSDDGSSYLSSNSEYLYPDDQDYISSNSSRHSSVNLSDEEITRILTTSRINSFSHSRTGSVSSIDGNGINKQFACSQCVSSFTRKSRLNEHIKKVHEGKRKTFRCNKCSKLLSSRENLNRHKVIHTDRYKCPNCGKKHDRSDRYHRHVLKCRAKVVAHSAISAAINVTSGTTTNLNPITYSP